MSLADLASGAYLATLCALSILGLHRLYLVWLSWRSPVVAEPPAPGVWPTVTVQLPVYNERYVVERLLEGAGRLRYPADRLQIQVLDDSDDDTVDRVAAVVASLRRRGLDVQHLRRAERTGYKAGALRHGLSSSRGELICVFDADFIPPADFLERSVGAFADAGVGMVQARWSHLNAEDSMLTRVQAMLLDAHFHIEHRARQAAGRFFNFNGTAGIWRRAAIEAAGGWQADTLTEDLDLSYRAQLCGWRFLYLPDLVAPAELPGGIDALKGQQRRWTQGAMQTARKLLGRLWRSPLTLAVKIEATAHLAANLAYPLMLALALLAPVALAARRAEVVWLPPQWVEVVLLSMATGSVAVFFVAAELVHGGRWLRTLWRLPGLMTLGAGLAVNNTVAVVRGLWGRAAAFVRTPKFGPQRRLQYGPERRAAVDGVLLLELAMVAWSTLALAFALRRGDWWSLPILVLFPVGFSQVAGMALRDRWRARREVRLDGC